MKSAGRDRLHQFRDSRIDATMRVQRKIFRAKMLRSFVVRKIVEKDCAQNRALGFNISRQSVRESVFGRGHLLFGDNSQSRQIKSELQCSTFKRRRPGVSQKINAAQASHLSRIRLEMSRFHRSFHGLSIPQRFLK